MPLFKGLSSKSTPKKAIEYITRKDKAVYVSVRNLFEDEDYAEQFADTMRRFGKGKKFDERKYYHFKLSCARKDNVGAQNAHIFAEELAAILFSDDECVIATHTDTKTVHSHIIVNAVNPITGKKLRITESDYTKMKDEANRLGSELGYSTIDFRKKAQNKRTTEENHIILKGGTSWKEDLREVIEEAKQNSSTQEEFISHLALYGVTVTRSKTEYSYLHPEKKKAIRGLKLGENYTKSEVLNVIEQNRHGRNGEAVITITGNKQKQKDGFRELTTQRSIGDIEREMQQLDRAAEHAHRGLDVSGRESEWEQRLLPKQDTGNRTHGSNGNTADNAGRAKVQDGDKPNDKKRDWSFSK
ncbi:MAG: relaxase/mobilization nuclease domain-containing protein [Candidatus Scatosoma sp.]